MKKNNIEQLKDFATNKGGFLVSSEYIGITKQYIWQCEKGHIWKATWNNIKNKKTWCPKCGHKSPDIKDLQVYAKTKKGFLLSTKYKTSNDYYDWKCEKGHVWTCSWTQIKQHNIWCQRCDNKGAVSLGRLSDWAESKNGKLLSLKYIDNNTDLDWQCEKGHIWKAKWKNIFNNTWCPTCNIENKKWKLSDIQQYAKNKNGLLLSTLYNKAGLLLEWQCEKGHIWKATWNNILQGKWCLECSRFKTEQLVKQLLENKLGFKLKKTRFKYNNSIYEFDGYNEEHKIAFEYHGIQHYEYPNYWHKTKEQFNSYQYRDKIKEQYCKENNIKLIVIPYNIKDLSAFISDYTVFND